MRTIVRPAVALVIAMLIAAGLLLPNAALHAQAPPTVQVANNPTLGAILVDGTGLTLYIRTTDSMDNSTCTGGCASAWPALQPPAGGTPSLADGVAGTLTVFTRSDGTQQVEYDGMPLYYFSGDSNPGDTNGQGIGNVWFAAQPQSQ